MEDDVGCRSIGFGIAIALALGVLIAPSGAALPASSGGAAGGGSGGADVAPLSGGLAVPSAQEGPAGTAITSEGPEGSRVVICETTGVQVGDEGVHGRVCYGPRYVSVTAVTDEGTLPDVDAFLGWSMGEIPAGEKELCVGLRATSTPARDVDLMTCHQQGGTDTADLIDEVRLQLLS